MIAPKRRLTNHALHGREEWFKRIFRDQIAEAAGILEVVLSGISLVYTSPSPRDGLLYRMPSSACKKNQQQEGEQLIHVLPVR